MIFKASKPLELGDIKTKVKFCWFPKKIHEKGSKEYFWVWMRKVSVTYIYCRTDGIFCAGWREINSVIPNNPKSDRLPKALAKYIQDV